MVVSSIRTGAGLSLLPGSSRDNEGAFAGDMDLDVSATGRPWPGASLVHLVQLRRQKQDTPALKAVRDNRERTG